MKRVLFVAATMLAGWSVFEGQGSPDLIVEAISTASLTTDTQTLIVGGSIQPTLRNLGTAASGAFTAQVFEDRNGNGVFEAGTDANLGSAAVASIAAGGTATPAIAVSGTVLFAGNILYVRADSGAAVTESNEGNNSRHTGQSFTFQFSGGLNPVVLWDRSSFTLAPTSRRVTNPIAVGDLDGDGFPEVVFTTFVTSITADGTLRAIDGRDGSEKLSVVDPALQLRPTAGIALGDIDLDGRPEIVTVDESCQVIVFEHDGALKWRGAVSVATAARCYGSPTLADLNRDGSPEIVVGRRAYSNTGTLLWTGTGDNGGPWGPLSVAADIDGNGNLEVVAGATAYDSNGAIFFNRSPTYAEGYSAVANLDADPQAEIVFKPRSGNALVVLEHDGTTKWAAPWAQTGGGPPMVGNFDADAEAEIGVASSLEYRVYEANGTLKWSNPIIDSSSGITTATLFDFDNDGVVEVVFADEQFLYIWRGTDGAELYKTARASNTAIDMPVVADVDADGHADIIAPRSGTGVGEQGIVVYRGAGLNWANTRRLWNQSAYSITNVLDDLSIPQTFTPNWLVPGLNNFRLNAFLPGQVVAPNSVGDLTVSYLRRDDKDFPGKTVLTARIGNGGASALPAGALRFTAGVGGTVICSTQGVGLLQPGQFQDVSCEYLNPTAGAQNIVAQVDFANAIPEGDETNNTAGANLVIGLGPITGVDSLTARSRDAIIDLKWSPVAGAASYNVYRRSGSGTYELRRAAFVTGTGTFADSGLTNNTVYWYNVRWLSATGVESPLGTEASAMPIPRTQRGETAPTITSLPVTQGRTSLAYQYQMVASDPDAGDTKTFELLTPPSGMTIGASTGLIAWTPLAGQAGTHRIAAQVRDSKNRITSQHFNVFVETQVINQAPTILSSALTTAVVGRQYGYTVRASDPDTGDLLSYTRLAGPAGLSVHPSTGLVSWLPAINQVGSHAVSVRVQDLMGLSQTQNFQIQVTNPNRQPTISSTPPTSGLVGATYSYLPVASDPDPGDVLTWSLVSGPAGATVNSSTGALLFSPVAAGPYLFTIEVMDQLGAFHRQSFTVNVSATVNNNPVITSTAPLVAEPGQSYYYAATATDADADYVQFSLVSGPAGMQVTAAGVVLWSVPANATGSQAVTIRAVDPFGGFAQQIFTIQIAPVDTTPPVLSISSPASNAIVSSEVAITGSVADPNLVNWRLEYQISGGAKWVLLNEGTTAVANGTLGTFPGALLANNPYVLRLTAFDRRQGAQVQSFVRVGGDAIKLGAFTLEYTDLRLPALVMPIEVQRRYDSRKPYWNDFGKGWALGFSEIDLRVDGTRNAYVTLPTGREAVFAFTPVQESPLFPTLLNRYTAPPGVDDKLENLDCPAFLGGPPSFACLGGATPFQPYNPKRWKLTTKDGVQFTIENSVVTRIEDRNGNWVQISSSGISASNGRNVQFTRDSDGRITQIADARGNRQSYAYDSEGRLTQHLDPQNQTTSFEYAGVSHLVTRVMNAGGCEAIRQEFDLSGRLSARVDSAGRRTEYSYDLGARRQTKLLPGGITTVETYDADGNVVSFTDGEGNTIQYGYDANGRRVLTTMPSGRRIVRTHDANGNPLTEEDGPNGGPFLVTSYQWTADNLLSRLTRPNGEYQTFSYNALGNLVSSQTFSAADVLAEERSFTYDASGRLLSENSERGVFQYSYDAAGNLVRITDGALRAKNFAYDATGNIATVYNGAGQRYDRTWDAYGLPGNALIGGAVARTQTWNAFGLPASVGNALGHNFLFAYSCSGELSQVTDPQGGLTQYDRNGLGRIVEMRDALSRATTYAYDRNGLNTLRTSPAGDIASKTWNSDGLMTGFNHGNGAVAITYDAYARKATEVSSDRTDTFTNDGRGRISSIVSTGNAAGTMSFVRNAANRLTSVTDRFNHTIGYTYDNLGRRASMTAADGTVTDYTYDAGGKIARIATGADWAEYSYDTSGRRSGLLYSNGVRAAYAWDARDKLTSLIWYSPTNTVIRSWAYSYDPAGRRTGAVLNDGSIAWTYDAMGRLTSETIVSTLWGNETGAWTYDAVGNRLDATATFGADHRLTAFDGDASTFDGAGNQTRSVTYNLTFDARNRLLTTPFNGARYNGLGKRDQLTGTSPHSYVYDGENLVHIINGTTLAHRYTYGLQTDELLFARNATASRFYITDEQGSVIAVTNETGGLLQSYGYNAWGDRIYFASASQQSLGGVNYNPFQFQGKEQLTFVELYSFRARDYRPAIGRFLQKDPAKGSSFLPASRHPYQFVLNRPTQLVDPTGLSASQYAILIKENKASEGAGMLIGFMNTFAGTNVGFIGNFIDRRLQYPSESIAASTQGALDAITQDMETVLEEFESWFAEDGASVAAGLASGAGYGVTAGSYWINYKVTGVLPF
jgi:RHS repeat-associated protein